MLPVFPLLFEAVVVFGVAVRFAVVTGADTYSIIMLKIAWKINKNVDFPGFSKSFIRLSTNPHRKLRILIVIFSLQLSFLTISLPVHLLLFCPSYFPVTTHFFHNNPGVPEKPPEELHFVNKFLQ